MSKRMLIDAAHSEETRMTILDNNRLEEYDCETSTKTQLKSNIYLAKVVRVEPSLQAAFVDYGGNRHGFLAFSEIHPDYYRIPVEDREALLAEQAQAAALEDAAEEMEDDQPSAEASEATEVSVEVVTAEVVSEDTPSAVETDPQDDSEVESLGGEDIEEIDTADKTPRRSDIARRYKIQEVIKRRQILLVQVVKEERGGKGAALTTYLSLPGRYCVLMPNAAKGGGVSRKITNVADRKRLRSIVEEMQIPDPMALIVRTAGMARTKTEIKRDCDFLLRLWDEIRQKTMESIAPALIYEEGDLIQRAIRDYYSREIDEVLVEGDEAYKHAKVYMKKIMPSHAKKVVQYKDENLPIFHKFGVEEQIDRMHNPVVQLKSGGYLVFGSTEALVAIDVNSGRSTRERNIDETAYRTNLEAAEEVGRQLRLRDMAGLVVIDFIDMDDNKHIEAVERKLKESMRDDRARVQVGRISPFGLMELSRQRLRPNIVEASSLPCSHCAGTGVVRSTESSALHVLRAIEEEGALKKYGTFNIHVAPAVALYLLNQKRHEISNIEARWDIKVIIEPNDTLVPPAYRIDRSNAKDGSEETSSRSSDTQERPQGNEEENQRRNGPRRSRYQTRSGHERRQNVRRHDDEEASEEKTEPAEQLAEAGTTDEERRPRRRNRRSSRRRRGGNRGEGQQDSTGDKASENDVVTADNVTPIASAQDVSGNKESSGKSEGRPPRRHQQRRPEQQNASSAAPAEKVAKEPAAEKEKVAKTPTKPSEKKSEAPKPEAPKKAGATRKGWWQRLLD